MYCFVLFCWAIHSFSSINVKYFLCSISPALSIGVFSSLWKLECSPFFMICCLSYKQLWWFTFHLNKPRTLHIMMELSASVDYYLGLIKLVCKNCHWMFCFSKHCELNWTLYLPLMFLQYSCTIQIKTSKNNNHRRTVSLEYLLKTELSLRLLLLLMCC